MAQSNSKEKSASDTVVIKREILNNCAKAFDELALYDKLLEAKETELRLLNERLELEKEKAKLLAEISEARKIENIFITGANENLKQAIAAKDKIIANQEKEIEILKKKKTSVLTILKAIGIGIGIGLALK